MPKRTPIINDFRAGELTPDMDVRVDLEDYYRGCKTLENAMPIMEGGISKVPGTYYVRPVKNTDEGWNIRITKSGDGTGVVTSDVAGINCGSACYEFFGAGSTIVLTGTPDSANTFIGWSGEGFSGVNPISVLMNGDKVINAEFSAIPKNAYLIGWYKVDEGSGLVLNNSANDGSSGGGLLGDMTVVDGDGDFWTNLAVFGSTAAITGDSHAFLNPAPTRTIGGTANGRACLGIFHKRTLNNTTGGRLLNMRQTDATIDVQIAVHNPDANDITWAPIAGTNTVIDEGYDYNEWNFFFLDDTEFFHRVNPDGTLTDSLTSNGEMATARTIGFIDLGWSGGGGGSDGCGGAYGDLIIYNFNVLTQAEWASWYDRLRTRYGMAARSGW